MTEQEYNDLCDDFHVLVDKYKPTLKPRVFFTALLSILMDYAFTCAPSPQAAIELFERGIQLEKQERGIE